jgi:hypothetical protein
MPLGMQRDKASRKVSKKRTPFELYSRDRRIREEHQDLLWIFGDQGNSVLRQSWARLSEEERRPWASKSAATGIKARGLKTGKRKGDQEVGDKENVNVNKGTTVRKKRPLSQSNARKTFGSVCASPAQSGLASVQNTPACWTIDCELEMLAARARKETATCMVAKVLPAAVCIVRLRRKIVAKAAAEIAASAAAVAELAVRLSQHAASNAEERRTQMLQTLREKLSDANRRLKLQARRLEDQEQELRAKDQVIALMSQSATEAESEKMCLKSRMLEQEATLAEMVRESAHTLLYGEASESESADLEADQATGNATAAAASTAPPTPTAPTALAPPNPGPPPAPAPPRSIVDWFFMPLLTFSGCMIRTEHATAFL